MTTLRSHLSGLLLPSLFALMVGGGLTACSDSGEEEASTPEEALAEAKQIFDEAAGVRINMSTPKVPASVSGVLDASGVGTHDPAFEGSVKVAANGVTAEVAIIATEGKTYAILPFTKDYTEIDPADYGAPDPAGLMAPEDGLSALLTALESPTEGEQVREGDQVITTYSGTLAGELMSTIIPAAAPEADFDAIFGIDDEGQLVTAELTGPFYGAKAGEVTYSITLSDYGVTKEITAPTSAP